MTKIQLLATLLALFIFAMLGACSNEDYPEPDVFKVTPDLRTRINTGIKMASRYLLFVNGPLPKTKSPFLLFHSERSDRNSLPQYSG